MVESPGHIYTPTAYRIMTSDQNLSYQQSLQAAEKYRDSVSLSDKQAATFAEIIRRIHRLEMVLDEILPINLELQKSSPIRQYFDEKTEVLTIADAETGTTHQLKFNRSNPDVPVKVAGLASLETYSADERDPREEPWGTLKLSMEGKAEDYYNNSWRIRGLMRGLPHLKKFECKEVQHVRNHMVVHPKEGARYSFGYGTNGPQIRPIQSPDDKWRDNGLIPNSKAFDQALSEAFENAVSKTI